MVEKLTLVKFVFFFMVFIDIVGDGLATAIPPLGFLNFGSSIFTNGIETLCFMYFLNVYYGKNRLTTALVYTGLMTIVLLIGVIIWLT